VKDAAFRGFGIQNRVEQSNRVQGFRKREVLIDNLLVRIHFIFEMIGWTGLAPAVPRLREYHKKRYPQSPNNAHRFPESSVVGLRLRGRHAREAARSSRERDFFFDNLMV